MFSCCGKYDHLSAFCFKLQYGDDTCLAYTISAICNLLSEFGISDTTGIIGSSYSHVASIGTSLSIQEQLFVLLRRSLKRAETLKLKRLVASSYLAMAKFDLTVTYGLIHSSYIFLIFNVVCMSRSEYLGSSASLSSLALSNCKKTLISKVSKLIV